MRIKSYGHMDSVVVKDDGGKFVISKNAEHVSFPSLHDVPNNKQYVINEDNHVSKKELTYSGFSYFVFKRWCIICYLDKKPN